MQIKKKIEQTPDDDRDNKYYIYIYIYIYVGNLLSHRLAD
jgi:hypothetical protein